MGKIRTNRSPLIKRKRETLRQGNFIRYFGYGTHHRFKNNVSLNNIYIYVSGRDKFSLFTDSQPHFIQRGRREEVREEGGGKKKRIVISIFHGTRARICPVPNFTSRCINHFTDCRTDP